MVVSAAMSVRGTPSRPLWHHHLASLGFDVQVEGGVFGFEGFRFEGFGFRVYRQTLKKVVDTIKCFGKLEPGYCRYAATFDIARAAGAEITLAPSRWDAGTPMAR